MNELSDILAAGLLFLWLPSVGACAVLMLVGIEQVRLLEDEVSVGVVLQVDEPALAVLQAGESRDLAVRPRRHLLVCVQAVGLDDALVVLELVQDDVLGTGALVIEEVRKPEAGGNHIPEISLPASAALVVIGIDEDLVVGLVADVVGRPLHGARQGLQQRVEQVGPGLLVPGTGERLLPLTAGDDGGEAGRLERAAELCKVLLDTFTVKMVLPEEPVQVKAEVVSVCADK